jgi:hypothetical protein
MDVVSTIQVLYPTAILNTDYYIVDNSDGLGPVLVNWNTSKLGTEPTISSLTTYYTNNLALPQAQQVQIASLSLSCRNTIVSGYTSSALGSAYTYGNNTIDQLNMASSVIAAMINANTASWTTPMWCESSTGVWEYMQHTAVQVNEVAVSGKSFVISNQSKLVTLTAQVNAATTISAVQAVTW